MNKQALYFQDFSIDSNISIERKFRTDSNLFLIGLIKTDLAQTTFVKSCLSTGANDNFVFLLWFFQRNLNDPQTKVETILQENSFQTLFDDIECRQPIIFQKDTNIIPHTHHQMFDDLMWELPRFWWHKRATQKITFDSSNFGNWDFVQMNFPQLDLQVFMQELREMKIIEPTNCIHLRSFLARFIFSFFHYDPTSNVTKNTQLLNFKVKVINTWLAITLPNELIKVMNFLANEGGIIILGNPDSKKYLNFDRHLYFLNAFKNVNNFKIDSLSELKNVTFTPENKWLITQNINHLQLDAIKLAFEKNIIIQGPPGTGKTETISTLIANFIQSNETNSSYGNTYICVLTEKRSALKVIEERFHNQIPSFHSQNILNTKDIFFDGMKNLNNPVNNKDIQRIQHYPFLKFETFKSIGSNLMGDVLIIDEASQVPAIKIIPFLKNFKRIVLVGDEQQLTTKSRWNPNFVPSLLDFFEPYFEKIMLETHYRSSDEALINFSSINHYHKRLKALPSQENLKVEPITIKKVKGCFKDSFNLIEVSTVLDILVDKICSRADLFNENFVDVKRRTIDIGVITFNKTQKKELQKQLYYNDEQNYFHSVARWLARNDIDGYNTMTLLQKHHLTSLYFSRFKLAIGFIDGYRAIKFWDIETLQGQEANDIIISTVYGPNKKGQLTNRFGVFNTINSGRMINVAMSRAKNTLTIITSLSKKYFEDENFKINSNNAKLVELINYIEQTNVSRTKEIPVINQELNSLLLQLKINTNDFVSFDLNKEVGQDLKLDFFGLKKDNTCVVVKLFDNSTKHQIVDLRKYLVNRGYDNIFLINQDIPNEIERIQELNKLVSIWN